MTDAIRDNNHRPVMLAVSSVDSTTPTPLKVDPATGRLLTDAGGGYTNLTQFVDQTAWRLFYSDGSGDVTELAFGANGTILTSGGATSAPTWTAAGAGDVTAAANMTDNTIIKGDGGAKGVQDSGITISDTEQIAGAVSISLNGSTSGATVLIPTAIAGATSLILPAANDTLVGKATTDVLTNKTVTAGVFNTSITTDYLTASEIVITGASKELVSAPVATYPSLTELTYLKGVTSAIQTQFTSKQATITFGTGVETALGVNIGTAGSVLVNGGVLGTPSSGTATNITGTSGITGLGIQTQDMEFNGFNIQTIGVLTVKEQAAADADVAGEGQVWVKTATPNTLMFTDDAGTDINLSSSSIRWLVFNLVEAATDCAVATNIAGDFVSPIAGTILQSDTSPFYLYATNTTAGVETSQVMTVDISIGGTSIMTTNKIDIDTGEKTSTTAATPPDLTTTALAVGDIITIDIDRVHATTAAKGLTVYMAVRET